MQKLNPNIKLPYSYVRGSVEQRRKLVENLNEKFFDSFQCLLQKKDSCLKDIKYLYAENLPEPKKVKVLELKNDNVCSGASDYIYNGRDIVGVTLELFLDKKKRLSQKITSVFMHENTHILSSFVNPKTLVLNQRMRTTDLYTDMYDKLLDKVLYHAEKITEDYTKENMLENFRNTILKFLKNKPFNDKINYLQDARYLLEEEAFAYSEEVKYAKRLKDMGVDIPPEDLCNYNYIYYFKEKADVLKELAFDIIAKKRIQMAAHNNKAKLVNK